MLSNSGYKFICCLQVTYPWRWHSDLGGPAASELGLTYRVTASVIGINLLYRSVETAGTPKSSCNVGIPRLNHQQEILASVLSNNSQVTFVRFSCEQIPAGNRGNTKSSGLDQTLYVSRVKSETQTVVNLLSSRPGRFSDSSCDRQLHGDCSSFAVGMNLQNTAKLPHSLSHSPQPHTYCRGGVKG